MGTGDFTLEAYVNPTGAPVPGYILFAKGETWQLDYMSTGSLTIYASTNYSSNGYNILNTMDPTMESTVNVNDGGWHLFVDQVELNGKFM